MLAKIRETRDELRAAGRTDAGFTLIELVIVVVVLGILAAIVVFSVTGFTNNSQTAACKSDYKTVETAGEAYYAQKGQFAAALSDLSPTFLHTVPSDVTYTVANGTFTVAGTGDCAGVANS